MGERLQIRDWIAGVAFLAFFVFWIMIDSDGARIVFPILAGGVLGYLWWRLRLKIRTGYERLMLYVGLLPAALVCVWMELNVVRVHFYNDAAEARGFGQAVFRDVVRVQDVLQWCGETAAVLFLLLLLGWIVRRVKKAADN